MNNQSDCFSSQLLAYLSSQSDFPNPLSSATNSLLDPAQFLQQCLMRQMSSMTNALIPTAITPQPPNAPTEVIRPIPVLPTNECCSSSEPPKRSNDSSDIDFEMGSLPFSSYYYPTHFLRGTNLQLSNGSIKKVEDLSSDDFLKCAAESSDAIVNASVIKDIKKSSASATVVFQTGDDRNETPLKVQAEHPFFVLGKGWASCDVRKTSEAYGLEPAQLEIGDVCIVLTRTEDEDNDEDSIVDIVTAQKDLEEYNKRAAWRESLLPVYKQLPSMNGRHSAPPVQYSLFSHRPSKRRKISELCSF